MNRKVLVLGILLLFLVGMVSPLTMGWNVEEQSMMSDYAFASIPYSSDS